MYRKEHKKGILCTGGYKKRGIKVIHRMQYIDEETGEITRQRDDRYTTMNHEGYKFPHNKGGITMFGDVDFPEQLSDADVGRITRLCRRHIVGDTNLLGKTKGRYIVPLSEEEIASHAGYESRKGDAFITRMIEFGIMKRVVIDGDSWLCVNPAYYMQRGKRLSLFLFLAFQDTLVDLLPKWAVNSFKWQAENRK